MTTTTTDASQSAKRRRPGPQEANGQAKPLHEQVPPHDLDAEAVVLSALLLVPDKFEEVSGQLRPDTFFSNANRWIYTAIVELRAVSAAVDLLTVVAWLREQGHLEAAGGSAYVARVQDASPSVANLSAHVDILVKKHRLRELLSHSILLTAAVRAGDEAEITAAHQRLVEQPQLVARTAASPIDVIQNWSRTGIIRHEPTDIPALDEYTGGGPVYGTRWYVSGAPDAGKTAFLIQLAHTYALRGIAVGLLAVDEEDEDLLTRFAQRCGFSRHHCEARDHRVLEQLEDELGSLPIRFYDDRWTIEAAAKDTAARAKACGGRGFLGVDSIQTVQCAAEVAATSSGRPMATGDAITERVRVIRRCAQKHRLIAMATSELNRSAYRSRVEAEQTNTMAASKWSGAIEYSARVLLGLRSVAKEKDLLDLELAKNKHGPRDVHVYLRIDRKSQSLAEVDYSPPTEEDRETKAERQAEKRDELARQRARKDAGFAAALASEQPGIGVRALRGGMRTRLGAAGRERAEAAIDVLGDAVIRVPGSRGAVRLFLDGRLVPKEVLETLDPTTRALVEASRPPQGELVS